MALIEYEIDLSRLGRCIKESNSNNSNSKDANLDSSKILKIINECGY